MKIDTTDFATISILAIAERLARAINDNTERIRGLMRDKPRYVEES